MKDWISGFLIATTLAIIGWFLTWLQRKVSNRDEQRQAVAALRFELEHFIFTQAHTYESYQGL